MSLWASSCSRGEGVPAAVATVGFVYVAVAHLAAVDPARDIACVESCGDGPRMNTEFVGEIGQGPPCPTFSCQFIDLDVVQASQDSSPRRV